MSPSQRTVELVLSDLQRLLAEEAHLVGQEVQDALGHDDLHRLHALSAGLDDIGEQLGRRSTRRPTS